MAEIIIMPKLGIDMSEGVIVTWYKKEGDTVKKGENFFSVETDKTTIDMEATSDGIVRKILAAEGQALPVTKPIAIVASADEDIEATLETIKSKNGNKDEPESENKEIPLVNDKVQADSGAENHESEKIMITPRARKAAEDSNLDLQKIEITGTGWSGGICEQDILEYVEQNRIRITPVAKNMARAAEIDINGVTGSGANGRIMIADIENKMAGMSSSIGKSIGSSADKRIHEGKKVLEIVEYSGVRKVIGDRLSQSKFTAPHLYFTQKVNMEEVIKLRKKVNALQSRKTSITDYIAKAAVLALQKYPEMNSSLTENKIIKYRDINLGIAVAAPTGLIVPNIKRSQGMSIVEIAEESVSLFKKAREGKLMPDEYSGGTFTISNLGMFGIENFTAIINPPESGILTISSTKDEPFVMSNEDGTKEITIKPMMNIQLTVDHRVIDGLLAAQFVTEVKSLLEDPITLLI